MAAFIPGRMRRGALCKGHKPGPLTCSHTTAHAHNPPNPNFAAAAAGAGLLYIVQMLTNTQLTTTATTGSTSNSTTRARCPLTCMHTHYCAATCQDIDWVVLCLSTHYNNSKIVGASFCRNCYSLLHTYYSHRGDVGTHNIHTKANP